MKGLLKYSLLLCCVFLSGCETKRAAQSMSLEEINLKIEELKQKTQELESIRKEKFPEAITANTSIASSSSDEKELLMLLAKDSTVIIKGKIKGALATKQLTLSLPLPYKTDFVQSFNVADDGSFSKEFEVKHSGFYSLKYGKLKRDIYLEPQSTLGIVIDTIPEQPIKFVGDLSIENNYLQNKTGRFNDWQKIPKAKELTDSTDVLAILEAEKEANFTALAQLIESDSSSISPIFQKMEKAVYQYGHIRSAIAYDKRQMLETKQPIVIKDQPYLKDIDLNDEALFPVFQYRKFLFEYFDALTNKVKQGPTALPTIVDFQRQYNKVDKMVETPAIRDFLKTDILFTALPKINNSSINSLMKRFRREVSDRAYVQMINSRYTIVVPASNGTIAPEIQGLTRQGAPIKLSDFRGKYVYVFVWATWCAPCKIELPFYEKMIADYAGQNIEFLGVSVDKDRGKWQESFMYDKYPGNQILVSGDWNSPLIRNYEIQSVPHFILIGPNGEILEKDAPRPTKDIKSVLNRYGFDGRSMVNVIN